MVAQQSIESDIEKLYEVHDAFQNGWRLIESINLLKEEFVSTPSMDSPKKAANVLRQTRNKVGRAEALKSQMESQLSQMADLNSDTKGTTAWRVKQLASNSYTSYHQRFRANRILKKVDEYYPKCVNFLKEMNGLVEAARARLDKAQKQVEHFEQVQGSKLVGRINNINKMENLTDTEWVTRLVNVHKKFNGHPDLQGHLNNAVLKRCYNRKAFKIGPNNSEPFKVFVSRYMSEQVFSAEKVWDNTEGETFTVDDIVAQCAVRVNELTTNHEQSLGLDISAAEKDKVLKALKDLEAAGRNGDQKLQAIFQAEVDYQAIRGECSSKLMQQNESVIETLKSKNDISSKEDLEIVVKKGPKGHDFLECQDNQGNGIFHNHLHGSVWNIDFTDEDGWTLNPSERFEAVMKLANEYALSSL